MASNPDPTLMGRFCREILPDMLDVCDVGPDTVQAVCRDVLARAEVFARLERSGWEVLAVPFVEEVFDHDPDEAPVWLKAATTVVVRNCLLEQEHVVGHVEDGGLVAITTYALGPLSHLVGARSGTEDCAARDGDVFAGLEERYPRAWACLANVRDALVQKAPQVGYTPPRAAVPDLPGDVEVVEAEPVQSIDLPADAAHASAVLLSGIDARFDRDALEMLRAIADGSLDIVVISALSRLSRNSGKLLRMLEFTLAHGARVLTTNFLLGDGEVWVRQGTLVKPDSRDPFKGLMATKGLRGAHRKIAERLRAQMNMAT